MRALLVGIVGVIALGGRVEGQDSTKASCFAGRPLPYCRAHWVTEASWLARLTKRVDGAGSYDGSSDKSASLELGYLFNLSPKVGLGLSTSANIVDGVAFAVRSRVRYWVGETAIDFAPGVVVGGLPGSPKFAADLSVMHRDQFGLTLQSFVVPRQQYFPDGQVDSRDHLVLYGGIKLGSTAGLIGAGADLVAILAVVGIYFAACGSHGCD